MRAVEAAQGRKDLPVDKTRDDPRRALGGDRSAGGTDPFGPRTGRRWAGVSPGKGDKPRRPAAMLKRDASLGRALAGFWQAGVDTHQAYPGGLRGIGRHIDDQYSRDLPRIIFILWSNRPSRKETARREATLARRPRGLACRRRVPMARPRRLALMMHRGPARSLVAANSMTHDLRHRTAVRTIPSLVPTRSAPTRKGRA